ncbi:hypothetical protein SAMN05878482_103491 [Peribacillus simplex]|uniref:Uncharacterized protein n=1 Tax=Peribacillus simplex TaxID=1478 RepID=A0A9X8R9M1_9BACI|nr:hypothetical protein [Peribacillus simplex]SIR38345.1 hypothetical protein SAMN05878482_103491 [Peribacillus simplex]
MEFLKALITDISVIGSIIGGLIGGVFTYLAVILTLNNQKKNEFPKKLGTLVNMLSEVDSIESQLTKYVGVPSLPGVIQPVRKIDTKELEKSLMVQAVTVDRETYAYVSKAFSLYKRLGYSESIRITSALPEDIKHGTVFQRHMKQLHLNIDHQIKRYTKKIE